MMQHNLYHSNKKKKKWIKDNWIGGFQNQT